MIELNCKHRNSTWVQPYAIMTARIAAWDDGLHRAPYHDHRLKSSGFLKGSEFIPKTSEDREKKERNTG